MELRLGCLNACAWLFGLRNAAQTFQRFVDDVIRGVRFVYVYIDDLLVASTSSEDYRRHLRTPFSRLRYFVLLLNTKKCTFGVPKTPG